jgi:hypothetical protein
MFIVSVTDVFHDSSRLGGVSQAQTENSKVQGILDEAFSVEF